MKVVLCSINSKYIHSSLGVWYLFAAGKSINTHHDIKIVESTINNQVELEDLYLVCAKCEHAKFDGEYVYRDKCYETHCLDCPVHSCEEGILEMQAEAAMS
jgi:hypothetical protein